MHLVTHTRGGIDSAATLFEELDREPRHRVGLAAEGARHRQRLLPAIGVDVERVLLGPAELSHLPHATATYLTSRQFFPRLIAPAFSQGLTEAFSFAAAVCLLGAVASLLRGGKYHHQEETDEVAQVEPLDWVPAQEAVAETEPLLVD